MKQMTGLCKSAFGQASRVLYKEIFTDETEIKLFGFDGRQMVRRKPNAKLEIQNLIPTVKHGGGNVILWNSMPASGTGTMKFIDTTMNKMGYLNILKRNLGPSVKKLKLPSDYCFQQDNDPKHTAHVVREWLLYNVPK